MLHGTITNDTETKLIIAVNNFCLDSRFKKIIITNYSNKSLLK